MKQLTKEMKSVLTTGYNIDNNEYWINFGNLTYSNKYVCIIYNDYDQLLCKIKYKRHGDWYWNRIEEKNIREWYTDDKEIKKTIKNAWKRYA